MGPEAFFRDTKNSRREVLAEPINPLRKGPEGRGKGGEGLLVKEMNAKQVCWGGGINGKTHNRA